MDNHSHSHGHGHSHGELTGNRLLLTIFLNLIITVSQVIGGLVSGSLALLSDAVHNFSDVVALVVAYVANRLAQKKATSARTFGYKRAENLAALFNSAVLMGIGIMLIFEAIDRFLHPSPVEGYWVIGLAILSVILNWVSIMLIAKDAEHNTNIKAAYLHLMTDVMTSVGVLVSGVMVVWFGFIWMDALMTIIIAFYLIYASWSLLKSTTGVMMLFTPQHIDMDALAKDIAQFEKVKNVHHLHVWQLNDYEVHLEAHLDFSEDCLLSEATQRVIDIEMSLEKSWGINHFNFQTEYGREDCKDLIN